jgi:adenosine deaminase
MNAPMLRHYKLQKQQLGELANNNHMSNWYPSQTKRGLIVEGTNFDHLSPTYI